MGASCGGMKQIWIGILFVLSSSVFAQAEPSYQVIRVPELELIQRLQHSVHQRYAR